MKWAILQSQFFADHPPPREFFELHRVAFPWSEEILPVYSWENQIYIAAVNPGEITGKMGAWPENWVLMQAEPEPLRELWRSWNSDEAPQAMDFDDFTQPRIPLELDEDTRAPVDLPRLPDFQPTGPADTPPEFNPEDFLQELQTASGVAPQAEREGVDPDLSGGVHESESDAALEDEALTPSRDESEMDGAPEGFEAGESFAPETQLSPLPPSEELTGFETLSADRGSAPIQLSQLQKEPTEDSGGTGVPRIPTTIPKPKTAPPPPASPGVPKLDPPPPATDRGPSAAIPSVPKTAPPPASPPSMTAAPRSPPPPANVRPEESARTPAERPVENAEAISFHGLKVTDETKNQLARLPEAFTGALLASKSGNSLHVIVTSKPELASIAAEKDFSLGTPSPFRIVFRTEKSYHGYVINSPYLDQFFQSWNGGRYPEHLTVAPLISGDNILGFVIAFGTAAAAGKANLAAVENLAQDLLRNWPASPQSAPGTKAG